MVTRLQQYLDQLQEQLPRNGSRRARIMSEIEMHLLESWKYEQERGIPAEEALTLALERFGSPSLSGKQLAQLEQERQLWQGRQYLQRAFLFLAPLLFCYAIAALAFLGYNAPRLVFIHFTNDLGNGLGAIHAWFVGILLLGWLIFGGPFACAISGTLGVITLKKWSWVTGLNILWTVLGLAFLVFGIYSLITG